MYTKWVNIFRNRMNHLVEVLTLELTFLIDLILKIWSKTDLKNVAHVDTSSFALKANLASQKTEVDQLDIDKLAPVSVDLSKLSDVVKNDVIK